jgi:hypothetical protein
MTDTTDRRPMRQTISNQDMAAKLNAGQVPGEASWLHPVPRDIQSDLNFLASVMARIEDMDDATVGWLIARLAARWDDKR